MLSKHGAILAFAIVAELASAQIRLRPFLDLPGETSDAAISPDGKTLVFNWWTTDYSKWAMYTRPMAGGEPRLFAKPESGLATGPIWSPDGKWIAYLVGGSPRTAGVFIKPSSGGKEQWVGTACYTVVAWSADSRALIAGDNGNADSMDCRVVGVPIDKREPPWELAHRGLWPAISPDGSTLAFKNNGEIHLRPVTPEGKPAGPDTVLLREQLGIYTLTWLSGSRELIYTTLKDGATIHRVEARAGAVPRDAGHNDGEFLAFAFTRAAPALAEVYQYDNSLWRIDLQAANPHFEKQRGLAWNVHNLVLSPDGQSLLYTEYTRGQTVFYASKIDGSAPRRLFAIPYERISRPAWSPDVKQIAFTGEPYVAQMSPSHLLIAPTNGPARRLHPKRDDVYGDVEWSSDGRALFIGETTVEVLPPAPPPLGRRENEFVYRVARPFRLMRRPAAGGSEEQVADGVLHYAVTRDAVFFVRQDAKRPTLEGLNLYGLDLATNAVSKITHLETPLDTLFAAPDGRYVYAEKHEPRRRQIMAVEGLR
ncbi:MAG TPA: hypothetical protein VMT15_20650 [Bryobacteraceae bacterium]|nr:hypothetical protein [Bryobacteraceae bacterium]